MSSRDHHHRKLRFETLETRAMLAGDLELVKDINAIPFSGLPRNFVEVSGIAFFSASANQGGNELWKSDGTAEGTVLVKDVRPGFADSDPSSLTNINGVVFFSANDGVSGVELWKSDGTEVGTVRVRDINPGAVGSGPRHLTDVAGTLFFAANDGAGGYQLWKSDGTESGTVRVSVVQPLNRFGGSTAIDSILYFFGSDGTTGYELWRSDGSEAGTVLVKDISPGAPGSAGPNSIVRPSLTNVGGTLYFSAFDGTTGFELWKSNGTTSGTSIVSDLRVGARGSEPENLFNVDGTLYFTAIDGVGDWTYFGRELWKSDGTVAGTARVKDIRPGGSSSTPRSFAVVGETIYFTANDGVTGSELWRSDGTEAGTYQMKDINPGADSALGKSSSPGRLTNVSGVLYFNANNGINGYELWKSDGTAEGTVLIREIPQGQRNVYHRYLANIGGKLYFRAYEEQTGYELWSSDGTEMGTVLVKDFRPGNYRSTPRVFANVAGTLYFFANDGVSGYELWKSDGTSLGTMRVKDILAGNFDATRSSAFIVADSQETIYFTANNGVSGSELWKSDGTESGTVLVKDIRSGSYGTSILEPTLVNDVLFFVANDGTSGHELWKSDGTAAGTVKVKEIYPSHSGAFSLSRQSLTNVGGVLFFSANNGASGYELWKSDGTEAGTVRVKDIAPGLVSSQPIYLQNINGTLYFFAGDLTNGFELWKSDGSEGGTVQIKDIRPGSGSSVTPGSRTSQTVVSDHYFFQADDGITGSELWKSDGTEAGTVRVKDLVPGFVGGSLFNFTSVAGTLYFTAYDPIHGRELWKSDGTEAGTLLVKDITPGSGPSNSYESANSLTNVGGILYFRSNDGASGIELWKSDGTDLGTVRVRFADGQQLSSPGPAFPVGDRLFVSGTKSDSGIGTELYSLITITPPTLPGDYTRNNIIDQADYDLWRSNFGSAVNLAADGNDNGIVDAADYTVWREALPAPVVVATTAASAVGVGAIGLGPIAKSPERRAGLKVAPTEALPPLTRGAHERDFDAAREAVFAELGEEETAARTRMNNSRGATLRGVRLSLKSHISPETGLRGA